MIDVRRPTERALLVGAPPLDMPEREVNEHLAELGRLADTAGADVTGVLVQRLASPNPATYIGSGKVEQLRRRVREKDASLVVFDEDLSPAQGTALEQMLGMRVMDRTELILDIFALRARTAEAKLQVELAQLEYMRPRLKRMWSHLSRIGGGIGARGPGEQQLETDRRIIDRRIARLREELKQIARSRDTQRKARGDEFTVALVGYTNAGKSSILRGLSGSDLFVEDRLFATLDSATRAVELSGGHFSDIAALRSALWSEEHGATSVPRQLAKLALNIAASELSGSMTTTVGLATGVGLSPDRYDTDVLGTTVGDLLAATIDAFPSDALVADAADDANDGKGLLCDGPEEPT
ncbi:MAG: GTPase HflX, partial [Gemmatimonadota bacterium]|nr:GTPase HflX [Gemmatimonadota bacterium]